MRVLKIGAAVLAVIVLLLVGLIIMQLNPKAAEAKNQDFTLVAGTSRQQVAEQLEQAGLIRNTFAFYLYSKLTGGTLQPGIYELSASQSASTIAGMLAEGRIKQAKITLLEGWRAKDIEEYLVTEKGLKQMVGFSEAAEQYEGYLFPDTYQIKLDETIDELIALLRDNFKERTSKLSNVTPDAVIMASIVEREAASDADRPQIAAVYLNRLKIGMMLQADPTIQYAKGSWAAITLADYTNVESSYNTYKVDGLPPGPICNPGLKSIEAVLSPATHDYLFFFHAKGQTFFSKTLAEHQAKVKANF